MTGDHGKPRLSARHSTGGPGDPVVFCADEQHDVDIDVTRWAVLAEAVLLAQGVRGHAELNIMFVDVIEITELNSQFMDKNAPTDVLSFPIDADELAMRPVPDPSRSGPDRSPIDPDDLPLLLGDIVICPSVASEQAPTHAGTVEDEVALLVVHGILHVLGFDHAEPDDRSLMWARERELLEAHHWRGPAPEAFSQDQPES